MGTYILSNVPSWQVFAEYKVDTDLGWRIRNPFGLLFRDLDTQTETRDTVINGRGTKTFKITIPENTSVSQRTLTIIAESIDEPLQKITTIEQNGVS